MANLAGGIMGKNAGFQNASVSSEGIRLAIVVCEWNPQITKRMEEAAKKEAEKAGCKISISRVPGCYDSAFAANQLLMREDVDAAVVLGAVIKGETRHDEAIYNATALTLQSISLARRKPIGLGIIGPGATQKIASKRAQDYAKRAVWAAIALHQRYRKNAPSP
jgi:6,7-dimethyl-8-ribityllumazine synthase